MLIPHGEESSYEHEEGPSVVHFEDESIAGGCADDVGFALDEVDDGVDDIAHVHRAGAH